MVNDKAKFTALLIGITFAVFLFVTSMLIGVLNHASATVINIGASMWIMDPAVQTVSNSVCMPDYVLDAVRSTQGVGSERELKDHRGVIVGDRQGGDFRSVRNADSLHHF